MALRQRSCPHCGYDFSVTFERLFETFEETMWSRLEETLRCSVCQDIFQEPLFLTCRHSFCKSCLQEWWSQNRRPECPLCRTISPEWDPPVNMPLKSVCEAFAQQRAECHSNSRPYSQRPVDPGAGPGAVPGAGPGAGPGATPRPQRKGLRVIDAHLIDELELFGDVKGN